MSVLPEERVLTTLHTVALAVQSLQRMGVAADAVLAGSGIAAAELESPTRLISHAQELRVLANALAASADPALGLLLGKRMHVSAYGMLGYTLLASRNLGEALRLAIAHPELVASLTAIAATYTFEGMLDELVVLQRDPTHEPSPELIALMPTEADFAAWAASFDRSNPNPGAFEDVSVKLNEMMAAWPGWRRDDVARIACPTLIAIGDRDFVRIDHAAETARMIAGAHLAVLPNTTHDGTLRRGAWLVPMIEARSAPA